MPEIRIACDVRDSVPLHLLQEMQGDLKSLSEENFKKLRKEILETGMAFPIHVWKNGGSIYTIGGHQRVRVLKALESEGFAIPPLPVVYVHAESEKEAKRRVLQDVSQFGEIETQGLYRFAFEAQIDIEDLSNSFTLPEIDLDAFREEFFSTENGKTDPDELPWTCECRAKSGELYRLGRHYLLCGDARDPETVRIVTSGAEIDMVFTDPPYGMDLYTDYSRFARGGAKFAPVKGDAEPYDPAPIFAIKAKRYCIWGADWFYPRMPDGFSPVVWDKQPQHAEAGLSNHFELCWVRPAEKRRIIRRVWNGYTAKEKNEARVHPTQKPIEVCIDLMERGGKNVLDLYGGSGSTLIACEKTDRTCFMVEIEPLYIDAIIARWEAFTGKKAEQLPAVPF